MIHEFHRRNLHRAAQAGMLMWDVVLRSSFGLTIKNGHLKAVIFLESSVTSCTPNPRFHIYLKS